MLIDCCSRGVSNDVYITPACFQRLVVYGNLPTDWCYGLSPVQHQAMPCAHGSLTRYVKLRVAHALGMPGTFPRNRLQRKQLVSGAVMYVGIASPRCREKHHRHSQRMHNPQFYVSVKRPIKSIPYEHVIMCQNWAIFRPILSNQNVFGGYVSSKYVISDQ